MSKILKSGLKSAFRIAKNKIQGKEQHVSKEVQEERLSICAQCPKRLDNFGGQCGECLCILKLKTSYAEESCPLGKWLQENLNDREI